MTAAVDRAAGTCRIDGVAYRVTASGDGLALYVKREGEAIAFGAFTRAIVFPGDAADHDELVAIRTAWFADEDAHTGDQGT